MAFAEEGGTAACRADAQKYCTSAGNKMECLIDHQNDISDGCYGFLKTALQRQKGIQACKADAQKYCASESNKKECLIDHQKEISDGCYDFLKQNLQREKQGSAGEPAAAPASAPIYKVKTADGRTVYTNAPVANGTQVQDRVNTALPIR